MKEGIRPFEVRPPKEVHIPDSNLHLRQFRQGDEEELLRLVADEGVKQYVPWAKGVEDIDSAQNKIDEFVSAYERGVMARYVIEQDDEFIGYAGLWSDKDDGYYEFGFAVYPEHRNQGIGSKSVLALVHMARTELGAKGIVAYVDDSNDASKAVVTKFGLTPTEEFDDGDRRYELSF